MKPDWKDAPDWANWLAMDANGEWSWFEFKPSYSLAVDGWLRTYSKGRVLTAYTSRRWTECLEERPC